MNFLMILYNILWAIFLVGGAPVIILALRFKPKRRRTFLQRLGLTPLPRGIRQARQHRHPRIWVHALSVGEVISAVPLVRGLKQRFSDHQLVFSASTQTGFAIAQKQLSPTVDHLIYFPYDLWFSVRSRIQAIQPEFVVMVETDIWPNFLFELKKRDIPLILTNARLSSRSFAGYRRFSRFFAPVFGCFSRIGVQTDTDQDRFAGLGVLPARIKVTGNLKFDQPVEPMPESRQERMRQYLGIQAKQPVIVAGSTHPGEEARLVDLYLRLKTVFTDLVLILVPRDPERAASISALLANWELSVRFWSEGEPPAAAPSPDIVIVDRIGVLRRLYAIAHIAFVGGSLVTRGGHNPLEPAAYGKPVLFGPDMSNFAGIAALLTESGGAIQVPHTEALYRDLIRLLKAPESARKMGEAGLAVFYQNQGAVANSLAVIQQALG